MSGAATAGAIADPSGLEADIAPFAVMRWARVVRSLIALIDAAGNRPWKTPNTVSDGNLCAAAGTPTLDGLGAVGGGPHAEHEWVDLARMPERAALVAALVAGLCAPDYGRDPGPSHDD